MSAMAQMRCWLLVLSIASAFGQSFAQSQAVSDYQVKAAYLYNFAKFVEWPAEQFASPTSTFRFCILDDDSFEAALNQIVKGKTVAGRPLAVARIHSPELPPDGCHILFLNSSGRSQWQHVINSLHDSSVLTVGEGKGFVEQGGMVGFVMQDSRIHFEVNHRAATEAGLRISARLLSVAKLVVE
jgi:hypothetical protein